MKLNSKKLLGELITKKNPNYNNERLVFNGYHNKFPKGIIKCASEDDVFLSLNYLIESGERFCIRAGGHSVSGKSTINDGYILDISLLNKVIVDQNLKRARVSGGAVLRDLDIATSQFGLATTGGIISNTGVAGLLLGGGLGWLMGVNGLACDNLLSARVLLPSGNVVIASSHENSDLLTALRGGGGNFGLVLEFELELMQLSQVLAGTIVFEFARFTDIIKKYIEIDANLPNCFATDIVLASNNDGSQYVSIDICWSGEYNFGNRVFTQFNKLLSPLRSTVCWRNYVDWQCGFDDVLRRGRRAYWKSISVCELDYRITKVLTSYFRKVPSKHTQVSIDNIRGIALSEKNGPTHYSNRENRFVILINSCWENPAEDQVNIQWTKELFNEIERVFPSSGVYSNYIDNDEPNRYKTSFNKEHLLSLNKIKKKYDPENLFSSSIRINSDLNSQKGL